ncbi:enterobactin synthase subunit EntD [Kosakonia oryziphila]|uniref:Enterobactin synthase component D n=1 Tax=Kosakonia oryziphila TaxID=1005667 RepID=A0A1C4BLB8_9ENTR|nr:enterobactin synthase subunit EntD [Kosakonia oryziphila]SCC07731.1 enterobactin synthetase component D [Kosakonia oryziphila]
MHTTHHTISLAGHTLHLIDFLPATFTHADLLWLPHHDALAHCALKRQTEHLAGRIAALYALQEHGFSTIPAIGLAGEPCWPQGVSGSISHSGQRAVAVVAPHPVGVDLEAQFSPALCDELAASIVNEQEQALLAACTLPFPLALTLAFSAKESLYKAFSSLAQPFPGFASTHITAIDEWHLELRFLAEFSPQLIDKKANIHWKANHKQVMTLAVGLPFGW